jgi:hypothetical protein
MSYKFIPYDPDAHRPPVRDPNDYKVYVLIMSKVRCSREEVYAKLCPHRGWDLDKIDAL